MRTKTCTSLILAFLVLASPFAFGQVRTAGVSAGNSFRHTVAFNWNSTDPNATVPSNYQDWTETEWASTSIVNVSGTDVTGQFTMHLKNGAEQVQAAWINVETGNGNIATWIIAANLNPGDTIYTGSSFSNLCINETIARNYAGGSRSTNHLSFTTENYMIGPYLYQRIIADIYWDRQTGCMVEETLNEIAQTNSSWETIYTSIVITESNVWTVSESPVLTPIPVGVNVTVHPTNDLELTFSTVTVAGNATTYRTSTVDAPILVNLVDQYYDIMVTANYSGKVTVSLAYADSNMTLDRENSLQMMQYTPIPGDISAEYGRVNILDIATIAKSFGATPDSTLWNPDADVDGNGNVNIVDISLCAKNFGQTTEWTSITTYVDTELNIVHGETTHFSIFGIH